MFNVSLRNARRSGFVGRTFKSGYRFQRHWDTPMATAFFFGETGAGLFIISMLLNFMPGIILGLLITGIGKTFFHLTHMGVPSKSWRAILRPDRSWISRGLWGIIFFVGFGALYVASQLTNMVPETLIKPAYVLSLAGAMMVVVYQGFAMSHSMAISLWSTGLMPISSMLYGLLAGTSIIQALRHLGFAVGNQSQIDILNTAQTSLLVMVLLTLLTLLNSAKHGSKGAQQSYILLTRDFFAKPFLYGVIAIGIILPLLILTLVPAGFISALATCGCMLFGFYLYRILIFKAGVLDPILSPTDIFER